LAVWATWLLGIGLLLAVEVLDKKHKVRDELENKY
jgi:hypothetical protein